MKTCMRYLAVIFAIAMLVSSLSMVSAAFPDVENDNKHAVAIESLTNYGIIGGFEDGTFRPTEAVTRAQMSKLIFVTSTKSINAGDGVVTFPDVPSKYWAKGYISWCAGKSIVGGYEDGTFRPDGSITFDEALKMVCAMLGYVDFTPEMWPIDVRLKGLNDLNLGEKLEDVDGEAVLTRAQVAQLIYNSLDKPMYQLPVETDTKNPLGFIINNANKGNETLKEDLWKVEEIVSQVVATENFGLIDFERGINQTKTKDAATIKIYIPGTNGAADEYKTYELSELGLESYEGKTDSLIALNINLMKNKETGEYTSATLKGSRTEGISGARADTTGRADLYYYEKSNLYKTPAKGVKINNINHYDEDFEALRRITFYEDFVLITDGLWNYHGEPASSDNYESNGKPNGLGGFVMSNAGVGSTSYNRWKENIAYDMIDTTRKYAEGFDIDSDGYFEYLLIEHEELFKVTSVTSKTVTVEFLHKAKRDWAPVPSYYKYDAASKAYLDDGSDPANLLVEGLDLTFPIENVTATNELNVGDIIIGYQLGDTFTVTGTPVIKTGYVTKIVKGLPHQAYNYTLNDNSQFTANYAVSTLWVSQNYNGKTESGVFDSIGISPVIGINPDTGDYNYIKLWLFENKAAYAESIDASEAGGSNAGYDKAIFLYATEKTEPQVNEGTKVNEVFYPAYLVINGRVQLVNLNPNSAIDGYSGDFVSQDYSDYRPYIVDDNGIDRIMYRNLLVTYTVDSKGYYSLFTDKGDAMQGTDIVEAVLDPAQFSHGTNQNFVISVNNAGIVNIGFKVDGTVVDLDDPAYADVKAYLAPYAGRIITSNDSILYYEYTKADTGMHEHIEFYLGTEIPDDFGETPVNGKIYIAKDEDTGLWTLDTLLLGEDQLAGPSTTKSYLTDARLHLFALEPSAAVVNGEKTFASYRFMKLDTFEETTDETVELDGATAAEKGKLYAWDATDKAYKDLSTLTWSDAAKDSYHANQIIDEVTNEESHKLVFTNGGNFDEGLSIEETTKLIAKSTNDEGIIELKLITLAEIKDQLTEIADYNANNDPLEADHVLNTTIGTYLDEDEKAHVAYIIIDWVDYSEEA